MKLILAALAAFITTPAIAQSDFAVEQNAPSRCTPRLPEQQWFCPYPAAPWIGIQPESSQAIYDTNGRRISVVMFFPDTARNYNALTTRMDSAYGPHRDYPNIMVWETTVSDIGMVQKPGYWVVTILRH